jgi:hypothetical protein
MTTLTELDGIGTSKLAFASFVASFRGDPTPRPTEYHSMKTSTDKHSVAKATSSLVTLLAALLLGA